MYQKWIGRGWRWLAIAASTVVPGFCGPVALQNATATLSQTIGANFFASTMIDGNFSGGLGQGWAIFNGSGAGAETAVFETVTDAGLAGGTQFTFTMSQLYTAATQHSVGRFRISVTTDARSGFADGLQNGGDVTAAWTVLTPVSASGTNGPTLTILGDGSVLASGTNPSTSVYTIVALTSMTGITGFRLEVLEDASLPGNGPGRQPSNGNFVLTEFEVSADAAVPEPASWSLAAFGAGLVAMRMRRRM
ncbi:MAG: PEP-CTERM sorting domain-containing protein [Acidobacteria bacterium]|nr:PEP-CTERM sorting domain-containing protein [Acidobacteriota bacterium]